MYEYEVHKFEVKINQTQFGNQAVIDVLAERSDAIKDQINLYANQGYKLHTIISDENVGYTIVMEKERVLDEWQLNKGVGHR